MNRSYILKYEYQGTVKVIEAMAKSPRAVITKFHKYMLTSNRTGVAKILEVKLADSSQKNLFHTHPILEQYHI